MQVGRTLCDAGLQRHYCAKVDVGAGQAGLFKAKISIR